MMRSLEVAGIALVIAAVTIAAGLIGTFIYHHLTTP